MREVTLEAIVSLAAVIVLIMLLSTLGWDAPW